MTEMSIYEREKDYIRLLTERSYKITELSQALYISEPTVRRDVVSMKKNGLIESNRGLISLKTTSPDRRIPSFLREVQKADEKRVIAHHAISHVKDGMVIMLDASTTAYCMIPFLADFQSILVITSGAKAALALASYGINTICTGGKMISQSYSYVGGDAIRTLSSYNADVAFFSCHGLTEDGIASDTSIEENEIRKVMIQQSSEAYLLCDKSKLGKKGLNVLCNVKDISGVISD
jgi:DeoR/GlpR family transcriptional regulator of sugar metabolism